VSGNNVYAVPNEELLLSIEVSVNEFPRENLRFIEVLGQGQFGEVGRGEHSVFVKGEQS
jgi:discoidin domain receptor family protein 2